MNTEIKQQLLRLTQENEVLRNCWLKEQALSLAFKKRVRSLLEENASLRCQLEDGLEQIRLLQQGFYAVGSEEVYKRMKHVKRLHNKEDNSISQTQLKCMSAK